VIPNAKETPIVSMDTAAIMPASTPALPVTSPARSELAPMWSTARDVAQAVFAVMAVVTLVTVVVMLIVLMATSAPLTVAQVIIARFQRYRTAQNAVAATFAAVEHVTSEIVAAPVIVLTITFVPQKHAMHITAAVRMFWMAPAAEEPMSVVMVRVRSAVHTKIAMTRTLVQKMSV